MVDSSKLKTKPQRDDACRKKTVIEQDIVSDDLEKKIQDCSESSVAIEKQSKQNTQNKRTLGINWVLLPISGILGGFIALGFWIGIQWAGFLPFSFVDSRAEGEEALQIAESAKGQGEETMRQLKHVLQEIDALKVEFSSLSSQHVKTLQDGEILQEESKKAFTALEKKVRDFEEYLQTLGGVSKDVKTALSIGQSNADNLTALKQQLETVQKEVAIKSGEKEKIKTALFIAINSLKNAVERGGSYINELKTVQQLSPSIEGFDLLQKTATVGLPNSAQLSADFARVADAIVGTQNIVAPDVSFFERIWAWIKGLIVLRPVGNVEGMTIGAIAARMEVAIQKGDYEKALSEWQTLPQSAKDVSEGFVHQLEKHIAVHNFLQQLLVVTQQEAFEAPKM
ncbi:COG4223 family protein [Bartonella sp. B17]